VDYDERLGVPPRWWALGAILVASFWLALAVALPPVAAWAVAAIAGALLVGFLVGYGASRVQVATGWLSAGRARIDLQYVDAVTPLDAVATRRQAGVDADARAYLLLRPYVKSSVRIDLRDPDDPTPYWLVSSRTPGLLVAAVGRAEARLAQQTTVEEG
jgi:Protein of unknown function (DUF3093)